MKGNQRVKAFVLTVFTITIFLSQAMAAELAADANNLFAWDLYNQIKNDGNNLFFSPYSIHSSLAMTYAGARGNTEKQMVDVLHFTLNQEHTHSSFCKLNTQLKEIQEKGNVKLNIANALWAQKEHDFLPEFTKLTTKYYGAAIEQLDFKSDAKAASQRINLWTEDQTRNKIKNLIPPGILNALTRLVLTNAIYFKGNWASQFKKRLTADQPFWISSDSSIQIPMMHQIKEFNYTETYLAQILELPYAGKDLSMIILLPKGRDGLRQLENSLTFKNLTSWINGLWKRKVDVYLPKFKMDWKLEIASTLRQMGMTDAFTLGSADFSGMNGSKSLCISAILHKAYIDVNEEGTEAAAATAVVTFGAAPSMDMPIIFCADHPFIFLIRENQSRNILFMGRVVKPLQQ